MRLLRVCLVVTVVLFGFEGTAAKIIHVPGDSSTIQGGINGAVDGDTVLVARGHFYERIKFYGKNILVASNFIFDGLATTIDSTVIDADTLVLGVSDTGSVVAFISGQGSKSAIEGFTLQNGVGYVRQRDRCGGAIYCIPYSSPTIRNNILTRNSASMGGAIYCDIQTSATISSNTINGNSAVCGGGIYCHRCEPVILNNLISGDSASDYGGGIYCYGVSTGGIIDSNIIEGNYAEWEGGGIHCYQYSSPVIGNNDISGNFTRYAGGGVFCSYYSSPVINGDIIRGNHAVFLGGGIYCESSSSPDIRRNVVFANSSEFGGGIACRCCCPLIRSNVIMANVGHYGGGGIFSDQPSVVSSNLFWKNSYDNFSGYLQGVQDTTWGTNFNHIPCDSFYNIFRDPMFADTMNFALLCSSACIDAGDPSFEVPDSGGRRIDIGAYEYPYIMGDANQDREISPTDVIYLISCIFLGGPCPCPPGKGDVDCNTFEDIVDIVYLINYLFRDGPEPGCF
jgi:hypothetical protein